MIILVSKSQPNVGLLIATSDDDTKTLQFLFDSHIVFGMYQITYMDKMDGEHSNYPQYQKILAKYPDCKAVAHLQIDSNYIPRES